MNHLSNLQRRWESDNATVPDLFPVEIRAEISRLNFASARYRPFYIRYRLEAFLSTSTNFSLRRSIGTYSEREDTRFAHEHPPPKLLREGLYGVKDGRKGKGKFRRTYLHRWSLVGE